MKTFSLDPKVVIENGRAITAKNVVIDDPDDFVYLNSIVLSKIENSEQFLVHYLIDLREMDDRFEEILARYFNSSIRKFYYYLVENSGSVFGSRVTQQ